MANSVYPDLDNNFPLTVDDFDKFQDVTASTYEYVQKYYTYFNNGDLTSAAAIITAHPELKQQIINAENLNKLRDAIISAERFYLSDFEKYVIDFVKDAGEWSSTTAYDIWSIVWYSENDNNVSYISIQAVPIGIALSNTDYWRPITHVGATGYSPVISSEKVDKVTTLTIQNLTSTVTAEINDGFSPSIIASKDGSTTTLTVQNESSTETVQINDGIGCVYKGNWNETTTYEPDNSVTHNDAIWQCLVENTNSEPSETNTNWYVMLDMINATSISNSFIDSLF